MRYSGLLRQASVRVLAVLLATLIVISALAMGLQHIAMERSAAVLLTGEILLAGLIGFLTLSLLFWWSLGRWLVRMTHRITLLKEISHSFAASPVHSRTIRNLLAAIRHTTQDEIGEVADAMEQLTLAVDHHTQEADHHARQSEENAARMRAVTQSLRDALVVFDGEGNIQFCSHVCANMFGWSEEDLLNRSITILFAAEWLGTGWRREWSLKGEPTSPVHTPLRGIANHRNGQRFPVDISLSHWQRNDNTFHTAIIRDITELTILETRDLRAYVNRIAISALLEIGIEPLSLHRKLEVALEIILTVPWLAMQYKGSIFLTTDDDRLEMVAQKNLHPHLLQACRQIPYGFCLCGRAAQERQMVFSNALDARHDVTFSGIHEHGHYCIPILLQEQLLGVLNLYVDHGHPYDPEEEAFLTTIANTLAGVIDRGLADDRVRHMASHDALTGLPNRMLFQELLDQEMRRATRYRQLLVVGFLDLDHFKAVNDTFGHEVGDLLLQAVSARTRQQLRDSDTLARMGGDEFALILPNITHPDNALTVCNKIVQALSQPFVLNEHTCQIGASVGVALFPGHGQSVDALLQMADQAMYTVKKKGRNGVVLCNAHRESVDQNGEKSA